MFKDRFYRIYHYANDYKKALQKQSEATAARKEFEKRKTAGGFIDQEDKKDAEKKVQSLEDAATRAAKIVETRDAKEGTDDVLSKVYDRLKRDYEPKIVTPKTENGAGTQNKNNEEDIGTKGGKDKFLTQKLSKYNKKEQKLVSRIYTILRSILPHDTAEIVITKIQEELSK